jgi:hypothetical protein
MAKVGQVVTIPTGSYCRMTLDSGEKIILNHEPGGGAASTGARLTVDRVKLMGFSSETIVRIDLDTAEGKAALAELTKEGPPGTPRPPLLVFVAYLQGCASVAEVVARCLRLRQGR